MALKNFISFISEKTLPDESVVTINRSGKTNVGTFTTKSHKASFITTNLGNKSFVLSYVTDGVNLNDSKKEERDLKKAEGEFGLIRKKFMDLTFEFLSAVKPDMFKFELKTKEQTIELYDAMRDQMKKLGKAFPYAEYESPDETVRHYAFIKRDLVPALTTSQDDSNPIKAEEDKKSLTDLMAFIQS